MTKISWESVTSEKITIIFNDLDVGTILPETRRISLSILIIKYLYINVTEVLQHNVIKLSVYNICNQEKIN